MSVSEKLITIAENEQKVYNAGAINLLKNSKYMHPTVSGEVIRIDDMANVSHKVAVNKRSKNIFNGELKIWSNLDRIMPVEAVKVKPNTWYRISVADYTIQAPLFAFYGNNTGTVGTSTDTNLGGMITTFNSRGFEYIWFREWYPMTDDGITLESKVQIEEVANSTAPATAYTPYMEDLNAVKVYKYGKNLFNPPRTSYTVSFARINGDVWNKQYTDVTALRGQLITYQVTIDFANTIEETAYGSANIWFYDANKTYLKVVNGTTVKNTDNGVYISSITITIPQNASYAMFGAGVFFNGTQPAQEGSTILISNPQVEVGSIATEYEPYTMEEIGETFDSVSSTVTLMPDTSGVILDCQYLRDIDKYIDSLNVAVAMTGGA